MKGLDDLRSFYESDLHGELLLLEAERKKIIARIVWIVLGMVGLGLAAFGVAIALKGEQFAVFAPIVALILGAVAMVIWVNGPYAAYKRRFKSRVIKPIVEFIDPNLRYRAEGCIPRSTFLGAGIFRTGIDRYEGDDLVSGQISDPESGSATDIEFSELHAEYKTTRTDSKGNRRTEWHTIFKGLFFSADFNKHFGGETYVLTDVAEKNFGWLGQKLQEWNRQHGEVVKLEDAEFEREFAVYAEDQVEARYILTPALMRRLLDFRLQSEKQVQFSFVGSRVYVAIPFVEDLFEPRLFRTVVDFGPIQSYFENLALAIGLVEDLNLNTRIWTKE